MRRSEEDVRHTEVSDASSPSGTSTTSYHTHAPVYAPTEGTETESYDLSNITRSSGSERDAPGSGDGSATGSPAY